MRHHSETRVGILVALVLAMACAPTGGAPPSGQPAAPAASQPAAGAPSAASATSQWSPELVALVDAAKREGRLQLSWSGATLGGNEGAALFQASMNRMFGTDITISFTPGPSMPQMGNQIAQEYAGGRTAVTDVWIGAAAQVAPLTSLQLFERVDWPRLLPRITPEMIEADGTALKLGTGMSGVTYNSQMLPGGVAPRTLDDFLKPEWKGRFASSTTAAGFDVLAADDIWGTARVLDYVTKLSEQVSGLMRCGETARIASGEFVALVMDCTGQDAALWQERGAPVGNVVPLDAAQKRYYYFSVPKNAAHPNAAKLFTVFMMTEEGQELIWKTWKIDLHLFPQANTRRVLEELERAGAKPVDYTVEWQLKHPEIDDAKEQMIKILTAGRTP
jgi:iron(III) transport system substrate-binding protein